MTRKSKIDPTLKVKLVERYLSGEINKTGAADRRQHADDAVDRTGLLSNAGGRNGHVAAEQTSRGRLSGRAKVVKLCRHCEED